MSSVYSGESICYPKKKLFSAAFELESTGAKVTHMYEQYAELKS